MPRQQAYSTIDGSTPSRRRKALLAITGAGALMLVAALAFNVPDVYALSASLEADGVRFQKRPDEGRMKGLAFCLDPDGYWIEIIPQGSDWERRDVDCCGVHIEKGGGYSGGGSGSKD